MFVLLMGTTMIVLNLGIQLVAVAVLIRYLANRFRHFEGRASAMQDIHALGVAMAVVFAGHIVQFASWAALFIWLGEFNDFNTAFYHSIVNFSSLGYGDIVMSERWRMLGALEACNGVLMFGLSAGTVLSVMNRLFTRHRERSGQTASSRTESG